MKRNEFIDGCFARTLSEPVRRSSGDGEVILRSNHPEFRVLEHSRHECIFRPGAPGKLGGRVYGGVDLPTHRRRHPFKRAKDVGVAEAIADDHQVDVAGNLVGRLRHRTVHEGRANGRR